MHLRLRFTHFIVEVMNKVVEVRLNIFSTLGVKYASSHLMTQHLQCGVCKSANEENILLDIPLMSETLPTSQSGKECSKMDVTPNLWNHCICPLMERCMIVPAANMMRVATICNDQNYEKCIRGLRSRILWWSLDSLFFLQPQSL